MKLTLRLYRTFILEILALRKTKTLILKFGFNPDWF